MDNQRLELKLLGAPVILWNGRPLEGLPSRAAEALLIYLACQDHPISREYLAEFLWSERSPEQALANLRSILSGLRQSIGDYIIATRQTVAFNFELECPNDMVEFARRMSRLAPQIQSSATIDVDTIHELGEVLENYRGDFLEGFYLREGRGFDEWVAITRERFQRLAHTSLRILVRYHLEYGDFLAGLEQGTRLVALDPFDEDSRRQMMWLWVRSGQPNKALQEYESLRGLLADELGIGPAPATNALYERFRVLAFPPRHTLPIDPTPFIGRESEIAELQGLLSSPATRLVTLFGPGGIGKTRLGIETARRIATHQPGRYLDGIVFISFVDISTPQFIPVAMAEALELTFQGATSATQQLLAYLKEKELLVILDDFERFLGDSPTLGLALLISILAESPHVKLLVTSRERLNLYEEIVFDVPGLALPDDDTPDPETTGSVALFLQTTRRLQRLFNPTADELNAIVQTCRLLHGIPLAIELAASWMRQYTPVQLAKQIESSLDFVQASFRNLPERHRSLRAVFDHSWELLSPPEQGIFCQLAIFEGGFTRDAVDAVVSLQSSVFHPEITEHRTLKTEYWLLSLADKSLLRNQPDGRFALHPLLRQFAAEKQAEFTGVQDTAPQQYANYYLGFVVRQGDGESPEQRTALRSELANIRAAWFWSVQQGDFSSLKPVISVLHGFYSIQSWFQEGIEIFEYAARHMADQLYSSDDAIIFCDLLGRKARMHIHIGQLDAAQEALSQSQVILQHINTPDLRSKIIDSLAISNFYAGEYANAAKLAEEILQYAEQRDDDKGRAFAVNFWGSCAKAMGDYDLASTLFERAVTVYQAMGDSIGAGMVLNNLGNLELVRQNFALAREYYRKSSLLFKEVDHLHGAATTLANEGKLALREGDFEEARQLLTESMEFKQKMNDQRGVAVVLASLGDVATELEEIVPARDYLTQALTLAHSTGDVRLVLEILVGIVAFWEKVGKPKKAEKLLAFAHHHPALTQEARQRAENLAVYLPLREASEASLEKVVEEALKELGDGK